MSTGRTAAIEEYERGNARCLAGDMTGGLDHYRRAIAADPGFAPAHVTLGAALQALGRVEEALGAFERGVALDPNRAEAHFGLGNIHLHAARLEAAIAAYRRALELRPEFPEALLNLGVALGRNRSFDLAVKALRTALRIKPDFPEAQGNLGAALRNLGQFDAAEACFRAALASRPDLTDVSSNLGLVLFDQGRIPEAIALYEQAIARNPESISAWRNRIAAVLYDPSRDEGRHRELLERFEARFARPLYARSRPHSNSRAPERLLRVGYVSSDFVEHPIARNLGPVLEGRDRRRFELVAYAEVVRPDAMTERLRGLFDEWRPIYGRSDEAVATQIRDDRIDVLVLLANRLDKGRPLLAAYRAAPVQVSFHDPGTSGLSAIEYLIADRMLAPPGGMEHFTERVVRLPSFYIHAPLPDAPEPGPPPSTMHGYVTFGSFNNPAKMNDAVLHSWGEVLRAVPNSRLRLKFKNWFGNLALCERVLRGLAVDRGRVEFATQDTRRGDHLSLYREVDVALDPYPFTGSTTTFEALWMGVPVVTLKGKMMAGRWGASMLHALKLDGLIASEPEEYAKIAAGLAGDAKRLAVLRAELRERVARSPLCDGQRRARQVERLYRAMWRRWCARA